MPASCANFAALLAGLPFELTSSAELGLPAPDETGATFLANALLKARHAVVLSGSAAIADDSGLEVDALSGAPGIYSARYAGLGADDAANNAKLLRALAGLPQEQRRARYRCALVFVENAADATPLIAEARLAGIYSGYPPWRRRFWLRPLFLVARLGQDRG